MADLKSFPQIHIPIPKKIIIRARYLILLDLIAIFFVFIANIYLKIDSMSQTIQLVLLYYYPFVLVEMVVRTGVKLGFKMYSHLWEHASVGEIIRILSVSLLGSVIMIFLNYAIFPLVGLHPVNSKSVMFFDWILNFGYLAGSRLTIKYLISWLSARNKKMLVPFTKRRNVLIMGAGSVGATVQRMIDQNPEMGLITKGFVDDDPRKQNAKLLEIPVVGTRSDIPRLVEQLKISEVIVAMPTARQDAIDEVCKICARSGVSTRVIPNLYDLLSGTLTVDQLRQWRPVEVVKDIDRQVEISDTNYQSIMVTGGAGFIGSNFVRYMLQTYPNYKIVVFDKLTYAGNLENLRDIEKAYPDRYVFVRGDIAHFPDISKAIEANCVDVIVNFAAETHVDRSLLQPESFLNTNVYGTYALLEAARKYSIKRFHQVSTDEVYGQVFRGSFSEDDPLDTRSPYSASKASSDLLAISYCVSFGVPVTITRGSNNIGPFQYPEKAVPLFITNALEDAPLPLYGDGMYVRDYQYVIDHCRGIDIVLHKGIVGEVYNVGGGNEVAAIDLARLILKRLGKPESLIHLVKDRAGQDRRYSLNCSKIKSLGWQPIWDFEKALDETIQWYLDNEWWWRKLKSGEYREYYETQYRQRLENAVIAELSKSP